VQRSQLLMKRRSLRGVKKATFPKGYALRPYQDGDAAHWARIISRAFRTQCPPSVFWREIANQKLFRPERVLFLLHQGKPVGTATAWARPEFGSRAGYVHMVALLPEYTGKRLGKKLTTAVLWYFTEHGLTSAFLHTDDHRLPAIRIYLELDFEPVVESEDVRKRWAEVFRDLKRPDLSHRYCGEE
jgi:mycothiol synthase